MILIAGPPCGGKTTYAREYAAPGETVLDFDDLVRSWFATFEPSRSGELVVDTTPRSAVGIFGG